VKYIDAAATTIDELKADIEEMHKQQKELEEDFKRRFAEQKSEQQKQWAREEADYAYTMNQKKGKWEDTLRYESGQNNKANREQQDRLDKDWAELESDLNKHA